MSSSPTPQDTTDSSIKTIIDEKKTKTWVQFEDEESIPGGALPPPPPKRTSTPDNKLIKSSNTETVTVNVENIVNNCDDDNDDNNAVNNITKKNNNEYSGAVITTESVQLNLDRSGLSRSISPDIIIDNNVPSEMRSVPEQQQQQQQQHQQKSASLKTIDLRSGNTNGRNDVNNIISTSIGNIRRGFANGDTIVTLLPVNTRWPWVTPAKFRPELVPEELMAQGLTLTVEDYVHVMELLVNDVRFNMYNICYKRILIVWIFTAFIILLGLLFSGVTGLTLFVLGIMWLIMNSAAIFLCMFIKIKLNHNLERCMGQVNKHLLRHKIILGLDDRGKLSCHKVNLCFIYFDTTDCIKKLQEVIEREEREGRVIGGEETSDMQRKRQELQQRMDIDDSDIVIQGSSTTRVSRKQERAEMLLLRYSSRWARSFIRHRLDLIIDSQERRTVVGSTVPPRHCVSARCPCQFIEEHLKYKPKGYPAGYTWCAYLSDPLARWHPEEYGINSMDKI